MGDTPQGNEVSAEEVVQDVVSRAKTLHERDLTTTDRLNKFFDQPGAHYEAPTASKPAETQPPVAESKPPEPVPSSKQTQQEQTPVQQPKAPEVATSTPKEDEHVLPEQASERTREQFNKLLEENRRLKQEKDQRKYGSSVFDEFRPGQVEPQPQQVGQPLGNQPVQPPFFPPYSPTQVPQQFGVLPPNQVQDLTKQFVDQNGNVDIAGLNQALNNANREAMVARQQAQIASQQAQQATQRITTYEEDQQVREAHSKFPEIDPLNKEGKFDPNMFEAVKARLLSNMYSGKKETLVEAAQAIASLRGPAPVNTAKVEEEAVEKYKQAQQARNQGPFETSIGSAREEVSFDKAREITRKGGIDNPALDERLRRVGIIS